MTITEHLAEKYEGVRVGYGVDTEEVGLLRPTGLSKLKEHYEELPEAIEGNTKVGLTDEGYAVYRNNSNDRLGYHYIVVSKDGPELGGYWYRSPESRKPHEGFGDKWIITP